MKSSVFIGLCMAAFGGIALADDASSSNTPTEQWLQLQASGKAASTTPQPQAPIERDLSMQRWLNNYQHPIPEFFEQKKGGSVSGSGGAGGS
ncbi:DUF3613 domain-containing protein [Pseudomonas sp. Pseu.R1]|uniref:DUF3613 domain-containing protein n=1 Tax=Pseudomonas sp. Pseu.R1 TaxID=3379818 RepID=UPI003B92D4DF